MRRDEKIKQFWNWFSSVAESLAARAEDPVLLGELDKRVRDLNHELSWEIGPGLSKPWQLVLSPNLNPALRATTRSIVSYAPPLDSWEFHSVRQPKEWDYKLELERNGGSVQLDASGWSFVLLRHPGGSHEVLLKGEGLPTLDDDERWQAAAITLESILGEELFLDRIDEFELLDKFEPRFEEKRRPIQNLRSALIDN